jgi:hypothetical protein
MEIHDSLCQKALANFTDRDAFMREMWPDPLVMSGYEAIATLNSLEREDVAQQAMLDIKAFGKSPKQKKLRHLINASEHAFWHKI